MFWITRQPINQVIDHPESLPLEQGGHQKQCPRGGGDDRQCSWGINGVNVLGHRWQSLTSLITEEGEFQVGGSRGK